MNILEKPDDNEAWKVSFICQEKKNGLRRAQTVRPRSWSLNLQNTELWLKSPSLGSLLWQLWKTNIDLAEIEKAVWDPRACSMFGFQTHSPYPHADMNHTLQPDCPTAITFAMAAIAESTHAQSSHASWHTLVVGSNLKQKSCRNSPFGDSTLETQDSPCKKYSWYPRGS